VNVIVILGIICSSTGSQSVSKWCSRSRGLYISLSLEWLPCTSLTTVAFFQTLVVAHCGLIPMTRGSCSCRKHIINLAIRASRLSVLVCEKTFHPDYCNRDCSSTPLDNLWNLIYLATKAFSDSFEFIGAIQMNLSIYLYDVTVDMVNIISKLHITVDINQSINLFEQKCNRHWITPRQDATSTNRCP